MKKVIFILFLFCSAAACDDEYNSPIPHYDVNLELNLNNFDKDLIPTLATKCFTTRRAELDRIGYGGILVVNGFNNGSNSDMYNLYAYDLACPNEAKPDVRVAPDSTGLKAICPKCNAVFNIAYGSGNPESGSKHFLRSYRVYKTEEYKYKITN
jgi:hypothetical protein